MIILVRRSNLAKIVRRGSKLIRKRKSFLLPSLLIADTISEDVNNKILYSQTTQEKIAFWNIFHF